MEPPQLCLMAGIASLLPRNTPLALFAMIRSQSSSVVSSMGLRREMPALLIRMSSFP